MTQWAWGRQTAEYRNRPCPLHGTVVRDPQWWTGGPDYVCPLCEDTTIAIRFLYSAVKSCQCSEGVVVLAGALKHLMNERSK